jgi:hypothetical protein
MVVIIIEELANSLVQSIDYTYLWVGMYFSTHGEENEGMNGHVAMMA